MEEVLNWLRNSEELCQLIGEVIARKVLVSLGSTSNKLFNCKVLGWRSIP